LLHRDFKGENILIDDIENAWLTGLEMLEVSRPYGVTTDAKIKEAIGGTVGYMPPEYSIENRLPSQEADIFAFGMTIIEVYTGKDPFVEEKFRNDWQIALAIINGQRPI